MSTLFHIPHIQFNNQMSCMKKKSSAIFSNAELLCIISFLLHFVLDVYIVIYGFFIDRVMNAKCDTYCDHSPLVTRVCL